MTKKFFYSILMLCTAFLFTACGGDDDDNTGGGVTDSTVTESITVTASSIKEGDEIDSSVSEIVLTFDANITVSSSANITLNGAKVNASRGNSLRELKVRVSLQPASDYTLNVTAGSVTHYTDATKINKAFTLTFKTKQAVVDDGETVPQGMTSEAAELVRKINVGWNLGNTCEAGIWDGWNGNHLDIETNWINPKVKTSKAMFTTLKNAGFNAVRIPVRWYLHADASMNIYADWMARIKEIVDYAVSQDMYVILNSHHDNWYDRLPVGYNEADIHAKYETMWKQIATYFKDYDEHLIFAGANEIIKLDANGGEDWNTANVTATNYKFIKDLMQLFVNTVRATGGNNRWRCLMIQPWACSPNLAINSSFAMPTDTKKSRLILEYHCYDPYNYAIKKSQHKVSQAELNSIATIFSFLNTKFVSQGIPVIMGEFGSSQDNSYYYATEEEAADKVRADYMTFVVKEAKKYNIPGFYWDNYCFNTPGENFGLLDRQNCTFSSRAKIALDGIMAGLK